MNDKKMVHPMAGTPQHLAALADAADDPDWVFDAYSPDDLPKCLAIGPGGECCREAGHLDCASWPIGVHVSFDYDRYRDWPVGYRSPQARLNAVLDPSFGAQMGGSEDYRKGVRDALALVRGVLTP